MSTSDPVGGSVEQKAISPEAVRSKYFESTHGHPSYVAMRDARTVAEWVSQSMMAEAGKELSDNLLQLGGQLDWIEKRVISKELNVPRYVVAALRTLQAYGNYATHEVAGGPPQPPAEAAESSRRSLVLVTDWFLNRAAGGGGLLSVKARDTAPGNPGLLEAWRLLWQVKAGRLEPIRAIGGRGLVEKRGVVTSDSPRVQMAQLEALLSEHVAVVERFAKMVLVRETTLDSATPVRLGDLALLMVKLSDWRPEVVSRSAALDLEELERLRANVSAAARLPEPAPEKFLAALKERQHALDFVDWVERSYLGRSLLERKFGLMVVGACAAVLLGTMVATMFEARDAEVLMRRVEQARIQHCRAPVHEERRALCGELLGLQAEEASPKK